MQTEQNQNGTSTSGPMFTPKAVISKKPANIDVQLSPEVPMSEEDKKKVLHIFQRIFIAFLQSKSSP